MSMSALEWVALGLIAASCLYCLIFIYPAAFRQMRDERKRKRGGQ